MHYTMNAEPGHVNFSPVGFRRVACDFLRCAQAFKPEAFSPVPFFLLSRAVELALKALHLETVGQAAVKMKFGHKLLASYEALPPASRTLSPVEVELLGTVSALYADKRFEYVQPGDASTGYSRFPDLAALSTLAARVVGMTAT
jgi:hypothetical protein